MVIHGHFMNPLPPHLTTWYMDAPIVGNAASVREWIEVRNKKAALKLEKLDTDLKNYKSNSIKVSLVSKF